MKTKLAVAMALVVAGFGVGLAPAPFAAAQTTVCDLNNFPIPNSQPSTARVLTKGASEVGVEDVVSGTSETLTVELTDERSGGELFWVVKYENSQDECVELDPTDCKGTITTENQPVTCELDAPEDRTYHVLFQEDTGLSAIEYMAWST